MRIKVRGYLSLRGIVGGQPFRTIEADRGLTVEGLIQQLSQELGDEFAQTVSGTSPDFAVLVNGRHCSHLPDRLGTELADGDEVSIFPFAAGGE